MFASAPIPIIALYEEIPDRTARRHAARGKYGPLVARPGARRYREVSLAEYVARFGSIDGNRLADAILTHYLWRLKRRAKRWASRGGAGAMMCNQTPASVPIRPEADHVS
jgi:hypothetical protein